MIYDNKGNGRVLDALRALLEGADDVRLLSTDLSVFAWDALRDLLADVADVRLLLAAGAEPEATGVALVGGPEERRFRNTLYGPYLRLPITDHLIRVSELRTA